MMTNLILLKQPLRGSWEEDEEEDEEVVVVVIEDKQEGRDPGIDTSKWCFRGMRPRKLRGW